MILYRQVAEFALHVGKHVPSLVVGSDPARRRSPVRRLLFQLPVYSRNQNCERNAHFRRARRKKAEEWIAADFLEARREAQARRERARGRCLPYAGRAGDDDVHRMSYGHVGASAGHLSGRSRGTPMHRRRVGAVLVARSARGVGDGAARKLASSGGRRRPGGPEVRMNLEKVVFGFFVAARRDAELRLLHRRHRRPGAAQRLRAVRRGRGQPDRDGAEVRRPHPDRRGAPGHQPGRRPAAHRAPRWCGGTPRTSPSAGLTAEATASVVSLSGGALLANIVSVVLLVVETVSFHRR